MNCSSQPRACYTGGGGGAIEYRGGGSMCVSCEGCRVGMKRSSSSGTRGTNGRRERLQRDFLSGCILSSIPMPE